MARVAALVYTRHATRDWADRWRERRLLKRLPAVRDAFTNPSAIESPTPE